MRSAVVGAAALLAIFPAAPGSLAAADGGSRTHVAEYVGGGVTAGPGQSVTLRATDNVGAVVFQGGPERYVSIEIADRHGLPVAGIVEQPERDQAYVCGATERPLRVKPYEKVTVFLMNGACGNGVSLATAGTVTATFTRR